MVSSMENWEKLVKVSPAKRRDRYQSRTEGPLRAPGMYSERPSGQAGWTAYETNRPATNEDWCSPHPHSWYGKRKEDMSATEQSDFFMYSRRNAPVDYDHVEKWMSVPREHPPYAYNSKHILFPTRSSPSLSLPIRGHQKVVEAVPDGLTDLFLIATDERVFVMLNGVVEIVPADWSAVRVILNRQPDAVESGFNGGVYHVSLTGGDYQRSAIRWSPCRDCSCRQCEISVGETTWLLEGTVRSCATLVHEGICIRTWQSSGQLSGSAIAINDVATLYQVVDGEHLRLAGWPTQWRPGPVLGSGEHFQCGRWLPITRWDAMDQGTWVTITVCPETGPEPVAAVWSEGRWVPSYLDYSMNTPYYRYGVWRPIEFNDDGSVLWSGDGKLYSEVFPPLSTMKHSEERGDPRDWYVFRLIRILDGQQVHKFQRLGREVATVDIDYLEAASGMQRLMARRMVKAGRPGRSKRKTLKTFKWGAPWDLYGHKGFSKVTEYVSNSRPVFIGIHFYKNLVARKDEDMELKTLARKLLKKQRLVKIVRILGAASIKTTKE